MLSGAEELIKKLNKIDSKMQEAILTKAVSKGTQTVKAAAKLLCPVDKGELRGRGIKSSVEVSGDEVIGTVYNNKEYASYVEFGTGPTGQENHAGISPEVNPTYSQSGWSYMGEDGEWIYTNGQAAQPFMYPALKNNEKRVTRIIKTEISNELKKLV